MTSRPGPPRRRFLGWARRRRADGEPREPNLVRRLKQLGSGARKAHERFRRLTQLSWPKRYPLIQFPNAPLILAFLTGQAAGHLHGTPHFYAAAGSYLAMIIWASGELFRGVNLFRHLLGLYYTISTLVHLALALQP